MFGQGSIRAVSEPRLERGYLQAMHEQRVADMLLWTYYLEGFSQGGIRKVSVSGFDQLRWDKQHRTTKRSVCAMLTRTNGAMKTADAHKTRSRAEIVFLTDASE